MSRSILPRSIAGRLMFWFLLISLVPSFILFVAMFLIIRAGTEEAVEKQLRLITRARAHQLKTYVTERKREIEITAGGPTLVSSMAQLAGAQSAVSVKLDVPPLEAIRLVTNQLSNTLGYPNVVLFTPDGSPVFRLNPTLPFTGPIQSSPLRGTELQKAVTGALSSRSVVVTMPQKYPPPLTNETEELIFVVAPVIAEGGKLVGAIAAQLVPSELDAVFVGDGDLGDTREVFGETGEIFGVVLEKGEAKIITPLRNDPERTYRDRTYPIGSPTGVFAQRALTTTPDASGRREGFGFGRDYRGEPCVASWTYVPELKMGIVSKFDQDDAYSRLAFQRWVSLGLLAATGVVVVFAALWIARTLSRPLRETAEAAHRVASGDLTAAVATRGTGEVGRLTASVGDMTAQLRALIGHIQHSIVTLMSTATEISATSRQQQQTVNDFGTSTYQVATAVNEISATSQELVKTMGEVNAAASRAAELATVGQEGLSGMHHTMTRLAESTGSIGSRLSVISERANNINLVVTTITKVADQTNLLSINAAIEAEKAGEYGRGFLVVAREIRRLADQTAIATLDIERIVREMQHSVTAGVMEMDKFNEQVRQGVGEVERIGDQLSEIIEAVRQILPRFEQVREGMSAQSQGADQIREAMTQLSEGAASTAESLQEFNRATDQLREAVGGLKEDISKFTT
jgi:methyl-accepting chemotaxis protein WspA